MFLFSKSQVLKEKTVQATLPLSFLLTPSAFANDSAVGLKLGLPNLRATATNTWLWRKFSSDVRPLSMMGTP